MYAIGTGHSDFATDKALVVCKVPCSSQKRAHISEGRHPIVVVLALQPSGEKIGEQTKIKEKSWLF